MISENLQLMRISRKPALIMLLTKEEQTEAVQMIAVENWPRAIKYIIDPCEQAQVHCVQENPELFFLLKNPCKKASVMYYLLSN
jgi:hypothetical protein